MSDNNPLKNIDDKINDPLSKTSEGEVALRSTLDNSSSAVKSSLIQLLMSDFNKVERLDELTQKVLGKIGDDLDSLDPDSLIDLLDKLNSASATKTKSIYELFRTQGSDVERILEELKKLSGVERPAPKAENNDSKLNDEKREKVLTVIANMSKNAEDVDVN